jgi:hypothetical protein
MQKEKPIRLDGFSFGSMSYFRTVQIYKIKLQALKSKTVLTFRAVI